LSLLNFLKVILQLNIVIAFLGISWAYLLGNPKILLKQPTGNFLWLSYLIFWPYFLLNTFTFALFCLFSKENVINEIIPNLYLGRQLWPFEVSYLSTFGINATLDLTAEFNEISFIRNHHDYLCIPILDASAPTVEQLEHAVLWIKVRLAQGKKVLVHCALGHGRSAIIIVAFILQSGLVKNSNDALNFIRSKRTGLRLSSIQQRVLKQYQQSLESKGFTFK
jgi:protein-tyrosine phosphatase